MNDKVREELTQCLAEYLDARHGSWDLRTLQDYRELAEDVMEFTYGEALEGPGRSDRPDDSGTCCAGTDCCCDDRPSLFGVVNPPYVRKYSVQTQRGAIVFPYPLEPTEASDPLPSSDSGQTPQ